MRGKLLFITGLAAGYVLGTRAGRKRYEQIKSAAQSLWHTAPVQHSVDSAKDFAKDFAKGYAGDVGEIALDAVKRLVRIAGSAARRAGDIAEDTIGDVAETVTEVADEAAPTKPAKPAASRARSAAASRSAKAK